MTDFLRVDDQNKWMHEIVVGQRKFRTKQFYSIDVNSNFGSDRNGILINDERAYHLQILNILGTPIGSEEGLPTYGSDLEELLFEPMNQTTAKLIEISSITALHTWMYPRLWVIQPGTYIIPYYDDDAYLVNIRYEITSQRITSEFNFQLVR